jgi:hypothetical protein
MTTSHKSPASQVSSHAAEFLSFVIALFYFFAEDDPATTALIKTGQNREECNFL